MLEITINMSSNFSEKQFDENHKALFFNMGVAMRSEKWGFYSFDRKSKLTEFSIIYIYIYKWNDT